MKDLAIKLEAVLFWKGEPVSRKKLQDILKTNQTDLNQAVLDLKESLSLRGIVLIEKENDLMLGTSPSLGKMIEELQKEELSKDLSKASLETLSIVLYKGGASRAEIDYIRGVNSNFILRALSVRGLVERVQDPNDNRRYIYKPTFELMQYMGLQSLEDLPEYGAINSGLTEAAKEQGDAQS